MNICTEQIKTEPIDDIQIEDIDICELCKYEVPNPINDRDSNSSDICAHRQLKVTIIREPAGPDEIIKEEPKFNDEYEVSSNESDTEINKPSNLSDEASAFSVESKTIQKKNAKTEKFAKKLPRSCQSKSGSNESNLSSSAKDQNQRRGRNSKTGSPSKGKANIQRKAQPKPSFECFLCRTASSSASNLKRHYDRFHGQKTFKCNQCDKRFSVKFSLDIHQRSHSGLKPFKCQICHRKFATQSNLHRHNTSCRPINVKNPEKTAKKPNYHRRFQCYLCKFDALVTVHELRLHLAKHTTRNQPNKMLPCNICGKIFSTKSKLAQHMLSHTAAKPFKCEVCALRFTCRRNLKRHLRLHTRDGLFQCELCTKEYTTKFARDAHQRKHNKK